MSEIKSPFILLENYIPLELCDQLIKGNRPKFPQKNSKQKPTKTPYFSQLSENRLLPYIDDLLNVAEEYYKFETEEIKQTIIEWYPTDHAPFPPEADGAPMIFGVPRDSQLINFTILFFLEAAAYGGNLEFPTHKFTLTPKAGTAIMYPSNSNFISTISGVGAGNLTLARVKVKALNGYRYNMKEYPGNFKVWF